MKSNSPLSSTGKFYFKELPKYILNQFENLKIRGGTKIVLLFIDGFGWNLLEKYTDTIPQLRKLVNNSEVIKTTSLFPSSTPAHLSTVQGDEVYQTGVTEWLYFNELVGQTIAPLMFSCAGVLAYNQLSTLGVSGTDILVKKTIYQTLKKLNISSRTYIPTDLSCSEFTRTMGAGSISNTYNRLSEGLDQLCSDVLGNPVSEFYFIYYDKIDSISHRFGLSSTELLLALDSLFSSIDDLLLKPIQKTDQKVKLIICSDHGQTECLNTLRLEEYIRSVKRYFKQDLAGRPLVPGGSGRDISLYVKAPYRNLVKNELIKLLLNKAKVSLVKDLIKTDFLKKEKLSSKYIDSLGDVLILPNENYQFWWKELGLNKKNCIGNHGGITPNETETPLIIYNNSN